MYKLNRIKIITLSMNQNISVEMNECKSTVYEINFKNVMNSMEKIKYNKIWKVK